MRALVTGSEGFLGRHLIRHLLGEGYEVWASVERIEYARGFETEHVVACDVRKRRQFEAAIRKSRPDVIYHLAAQSHPTTSWKNPKLTIETNIQGTVNLFESIIAQEIDPTVIVACSSAEYGLVREDEVPVKESHPLQPLHPYGVSKVAQDFLTYQYFKNNGVKGIRARIFNTTGPGKVKDAVSDFTKRVTECASGKTVSVRHGNIGTRRDITDARDMVRALRICEKLEYGDAYNICSMKTHLMSDLLERLIELTGKPIRAEYDPLLVRPTDEPVIMGDNTKFSRKTGWKPEIGMDDTLRDMLAYWRAKV